MITRNYAKDTIGIFTRILSKINALMVLQYINNRSADKCNIIDKPNLRSSHTSITLWGGGITFLVSAWIWAAFFGSAYPWFLVGLTAISFVDDIHSVPN